MCAMLITLSVVLRRCCYRSPLLGVIVVIAIKVKPLKPVSSSLIFGIEICYPFLAPKVLLDQLRHLIFALFPAPPARPSPVIPYRWTLQNIRGHQRVRLLHGLRTYHHLDSFCYSLSRLGHGHAAVIVTTSGRAYATSAFSRRPIGGVPLLLWPHSAELLPSSGSQLPPCLAPAVLPCGEPLFRLGA